MTARELAERLEVSERTIYRDLEALSTAGIPVYAERGPGGGCILVDGYQTNLTGLTESEVLALFTLRTPGPLTDLGLDKALDDALLKISAALPAASREDAERMQQRIYLDTASWHQSEEAVPYLQTIQQAVWADRRILLTYGNSNSLENHTNHSLLINPYGLVAKANIWYLIGATESKIQVFRVSRIQNVTVTEEHFKRPTEFDLTVYWKEYCECLEVNYRQRKELKQKISKKTNFQHVSAGADCPPHRARFKKNKFQNGSTAKQQASQGGRTKKPKTTSCTASMSQPNKKKHFILLSFSFATLLLQQLRAA
jgi:predicted DNA-binding transcriptional regulator YafY